MALNPTILNKDKNKLFFTSDNSFTKFAKADNNSLKRFYLMKCVLIRSDN